MNDKKRLLELISKREEMCSEPLNYEHVLEWLEELHYLFGKLDFSSSITPKIRRIIEQIFFFSNNKNLLKEKIVLVKVKLSVFEKYEAEKLRKS
ncbi:hypothetical protein A6V39_01810 [Candidatus Mycoplasma haematobovis]|uniref:Uncharacterized protein n=1 Tax=Candidatus Mycoplasma haematobovis TaxID=432608 RepID=A0A1A9QGA7_9MOLU|nr:hypothetical protein [Candidatus Mycoplasma haematobovis]OAL10779.1 hypothetical protein A6V39_01810 [Candidatus Mycoplasma haematobovis]